MIDGMLAADTVEGRADNIFWLPKEAHWCLLQKNAKHPTIGKVYCPPSRIDRAA